MGVLYFKTDPNLSADSFQSTAHNSKSCNASGKASARGRLKCCRCIWDQIWPQSGNLEHGLWIGQKSKWQMQLVELTLLDSKPPQVLKLQMCWSQQLWRSWKGFSEVAIIFFRRFHIGWDYFNAKCPGCSPSVSIKSLRRLAVPSAVEFEDPIWSGEVRDHQSAEAGTAGTATEHHQRGFVWEATRNPKFDSRSSFSLWKCCEFGV